MPVVAPECSNEADLVLLHRFVETGDPATFAEIVQRYARVVYAASIRILEDDGRAQDVSQETFFRLMQRPRLVTHSLAGWLHRTATHLALDVRRGEKSRRQREQRYGLQQQEQQQQARAAMPTWAEVSPFVDQALNEIGEPARSLLIRHFLQGIAQNELAVELDVSAATLSRRIKSGLQQLQENLQKKGIYLSLGVLAGFCAAQTHAAVPAGFVTEMAKMKLVGSLPRVPARPPQPTGPQPASLPVQQTIRELATAKFGSSAFWIAVLIAALVLAGVASWMNASPLSPNQNTERVAHDR